jgi:peroxiredoxin
MLNFKIYKFMKIKLLFALLFITVPFLSFAQSVIFEPASASPGDEIRITYDPTNSVLYESQEIEILAFLINGNKPSSVQLDLSKEQNNWVGSFDTTDSTTSVSLLIIDKDKKDNNKGQGYNLLLHDKHGNPLPEAKISLNSFFQGIGGYILDLEIEKGDILNVMDNAFAEQPQLKEKYLGPYFFLLSSLKVDESEAIIKQEIDNILDKKELDNQDYLLLMQAYRSLEDKVNYEKYEALANSHNKEPNARDLYMMVYKESDTDKKVAVFDSLVALYPDHDIVPRLLNNITHSYIKEKKWDAIVSFFKENELLLTTNEYNDAGWHMAEKGGDLEIAEAYALKGVEMARNDLKSNEREPFYRTGKQIKDSKMYSLGHKLHTHGFVLMQQERYSEAVPILKDALENLKEEEAYINTRYVEALYLTGKKEEALGEAERLIADGKSDKKLKDLYEEVWIALEKPESAFETKLSQLEALARAEQKVELAKKMISKEAPDFTLQNMEGETVALSKLKGKTLILDFWATWCGPCIKSFPAMDQAVKKFKDNDKVEFLFINSWEKGEDKKEKVKDFIAKKNVDFNVLFDEDDAIVKAYEVSGIPTKFVVDPEGKIRFKSVGFGGNNAEVVEELTLMIEMSQDAILANK